VQRVNLFEKVLIPASRDATRRIRIHLGDQMTAGVGRAKMAKSKLETLDMVHAPAAAAPAGGRP
jgi:vacuolar-type H+-ATPase subunit D/Vma8